MSQLLSKGCWSSTQPSASQDTAYQRSSTQLPFPEPLKSQWASWGQTLRRGSWLKTEVTLNKTNNKTQHQDPQPLKTPNQNPAPPFHPMRQTASAVSEGRTLRVPPSLKEIWDRLLSLTSKAAPVSVCEYKPLPESNTQEAVPPIGSWTIQAL